MRRHAMATTRRTGPLPDGRSKPQSLRYLLAEARDTLVAPSSVRANAGSETALRSDRYLVLMSGVRGMAHVNGEALLQAFRAGNLYYVHSRKLSESGSVIETSVLSINEKIDDTRGRKGSIWEETWSTPCSDLIQAMRSSCVRSLSGAG